jgi:hypothetical protein
LYFVTKKVVGVFVRFRAPSSFITLPSAGSEANANLVIHLLLD